MMKFFKIFFLSCFFGLFLTSCIKPLQIGSIQNIKFNEINTSGLKLLVTVSIENPNMFKINITNMDMDISVNDLKFSNVKIKHKFSLKRNSSDIYEIPLTLQFKDALEGALSLPKIISSKKIAIGLNGKIDVRAILIKKTIDVNITEEINLGNNK